MKELFTYLKYLYYRNRGRNYIGMYNNIVKNEFDYDFFKAEKFFPFLIEFKKEAINCRNKARAAKTTIRKAGMFD